MKFIAKKILAFLAKKILAKYKPKVVGITGSVGKTSAKEAIATVLATRYRVGKASKNFNNEFGLPFAILGVKDSPGTNPFAWMSLFVHGLWLLLWRRQFPEVLVLEMGVDKPGDMDYLLSVVVPDIAVMTTIGISHYEFFKTAEAIAAEKGKLIAALSPKGVAVLNTDDQYVWECRNNTKASILSFGFSEQSTVRIVKANERYEQGKYETDIEIQTPRGMMSHVVPMLGHPHVMALAAAIAVGEALSLEKDLMVQGLTHYRPTPGRLTIIPGIKHTTIIDDTYNAAPASVTEALELLYRIPAPHKIVILGDMLELGELSDKSHRDIGTGLKKELIDVLVTIGPEASFIAEEAEKNGMPKEHMHTFGAVDEALSKIGGLVVAESLILVKGSQGMRLEKITKEIMAEPMRASELLCRQYGKWLET